MWKTLCKLFSVLVYISPSLSRISRMHFSNCTHFILMLSSTIHLKNFQVLLLCFFIFHVLDRISARSAVLEWQCSIAVGSFTIFLHSFLKCAFSVFMIFCFFTNKLLKVFSSLSHFNAFLPWRTFLIYSRAFWSYILQSV